MDTYTRSSSIDQQILECHCWHESDDTFTRRYARTKYIFGLRPPSEACQIFTNLPELPRPPSPFPNAEPGRCQSEAGRYRCDGGDRRADARSGAVIFAANQENELLGVEAIGELESALPELRVMATVWHPQGPRSQGNRIWNYGRSGRLPDAAYDPSAFKPKPARHYRSIPWPRSRHRSRSLTVEVIPSRQMPGERVVASYFLV